MKNIKAASTSTIVVIIVTVIITILGELSKTFKDFLTSVSGHHWVTKSLVAIVLFLVLSFIFSKSFKDEVDVWKEVKLVSLITILGIILILGFYAWHFFA